MKLQFKIIGKTNRFSKKGLTKWDLKAIQDDLKEYLEMMFDYENKALSDEYKDDRLKKLHIQKLKISVDEKK